MTNEAPARARGGGTGFAVLALIAARVLAGAMSAAVGLVVPRALTEVDSAHYGIVVGVAQMLVVLGDLGMTTSLARAIAEGRVLAPVLRRVVALRLAVAVVVGGGFALVGALLGAGVNLPFITAEGFPPHYVQLAGVLVAAYSLSGMCVGLLPALRRTRALFVVTVLQPTLEFGGIALAWWLGYHGGGIIVASTTAALVVGLLGLAVVIRSIVARADAPLEAGVDAATVASIRAYGWPMFLVAISFTLFGQVDQLVIYAMHGATAAAAYIWNWRLITLLHMPGLAAATIVAPRLAGAAGDAKRALFSGWLRLLAVAYLGIAACSAAVAPWLVPAALGQTYKDDWQVFVMLAPYAALLGVAPVVTMAANFLGGAGRRVRLGAVTIILNLAIDLALVPSMGRAGAAIGTTIAFSWYVGAHTTLSWRLLGGRVRELAGGSDLPRAASATVGVVVLAAIGVGISNATGTAVAAAGWGVFAAAAIGGLAGFVPYAAGSWLALRAIGIDLTSVLREEVPTPAPADLAIAAAVAADTSPTTEEGAA